MFSSRAYLGLRPRPYLAHAVRGGLANRLVKRRLNALREGRNQKKASDSPSHRRGLHRRSVEGMRVGVVGCGLIGGKRAEALAGSGDRLSATFDVVPERARAL